MAEKKLKIKITTEGAQKSAQQANSLTASYKKVAGSIAAMGAAYLVVTKAAKALAQTVTMASEQEKIFKKLEIAANLAGAGYDNLSGSVKDYLDELQAATEYGDTETAASLTQMTQLSGDFDASLKTLPLALDLAATGLFNLDTASKYMGMALAGNVEMLGRYIPELKSTVTPQLKLMTAAEKTAFAMDLLQKKFGGTAQANLDTYAGKVKQLQNYWGDFQEMIGDKVIPTLSRATVAATGFIKSLTQTSLEKTINELKQYGASAEKIQQLEKMGMQADLAAARVELVGLNAGMLTTAQLEEEVNARMEERRQIANKLANETITLENHRKELQINLNAGSEYGVKLMEEEIKKQEEVVRGVQEEVKEKNKSLEEDQKIYDVLLEIESKTQQIAALSAVPEIEPPDVPEDLTMPTIEIPVEYKRIESDVGGTEWLEEEQEKVRQQYEKSLQEQAELKQQYDDEGKDRLQLQQEAEIEKWKEYYDTLIDLDGSFQAKKTEINERYATLRENVSLKEFARETQQVGRLVGALGDLAEATGANAEQLKVIKSGEAIINTYAGAARALADYPAPASYIVAATVIASGIANVAKINATGFQFGTGDEGFTVPSGNPRDSYLFAAQSGENVTVTPAGKPSGSNNAELIAAVERLETALAKQPKYIIRTIDDIKVSEMAESGGFARSRV